MEPERLSLSASEEKRSESLSLVADESQVTCLETSLAKRSQGLSLNKPVKEGVLIGVTIEVLPEMENLGDWI